MLRQTLPLLLVFAPIAVHAQAQPPFLIQSGAPIQIPVPAGANEPRIQVLIAGSNTVLDDERATIQNGFASGKLEADPGTYDVRLVSNDKTRTPIGPARSFQIPGFKREAGRWLFNGSPVVYEGTNPATLTSVLPGLRRDKKTKLPASVATNAQVKWDIKTFGAEFSPTIRLVSSEGRTISPGFTSAKEDFQKQQAQRDASNPNGALLLALPNEAQEFRLWQAAYIDVLAPLTDGIIIDGSSTPDANWLLKVARRNVEETPNFDLPLFARFLSPSTDSQILRAFQDGASNVIVTDGTTSPVLDVLSRQSARFSGAVTVEDAGLRVNDFARFAPMLRRAGRSPLLGRLPGEGNSENKDDSKTAESLVVSFDATTDSAVLDKIERATKVGATIYCEGTLPSALLPRWSEITKTQIAALATPQKATVTLADPWFWGTINDQNFDATQSVTVSVKPSIAAQTRDVKGQARETVARPIAGFNGDPNAIMLCPVDKGRIIWAPFSIAPQPRSRTRVDIGFIYDNDLTPVGPSLSPSATMSGALLTAYYAAIAGAMQPALVEYTATDGGDAANVSVAMRAIPANAKDPKSSPISLIAFFNASNEPIDLNTDVRGNGEYAIDLMTNKTIPIKIRDFGTRMTLQIPANGFRWLALAKNGQAWDDAGKNGVKAQLR